MLFLQPGRWAGNQPRPSAAPHLATLTRPVKRGGNSGRRSPRQALAEVLLPKRDTSAVILFSA